MNNNKSLLVGSILCILGAASIYALNWVNFHFMSSSLWQVADICGNLERYLDMQGYRTLGICIKGGAILSLLFMAIDAYKILKPLLNDNKSDLVGAKSAGKGSVISIVYTLAFALLIYSVNEGDMDGASITLWPVASIALCIVSKLMLSHIETVAESEAKQLFSNSVATQGLKQNGNYGIQNKAGKILDELEEYITIPVVNFSASCPLQPCQFVVQKDDREAALLIADYSKRNCLQALRVTITFFDIFDDNIYGGKVTFQTFKKLRFDGRDYLLTEYKNIDMLKNRADEIAKSYVAIDRIKCSDNSIEIPTDYVVSPLETKNFRELQMNNNWDAMCWMQDKEDSWVCMCGKVNSLKRSKCVRCNRDKGESVRKITRRISQKKSTLTEPECESILEALDYADSYDELISVLDQCIMDGIEGIEGIKKTCITLNKRNGGFGKEYMKEAKKAVIEQIKTRKKRQDA